MHRDLARAPRVGGCHRAAVNISVRLAFTSSPSALCFIMCFLGGVTEVHFVLESTLQHKNQRVQRTQTIPCAFSSSHDLTPTIYAPRPVFYGLAVGVYNRHEEAALLVETTVVDLASANVRMTDVNAAHQTRLQDKRQSAKGHHLLPQHDLSAAADNVNVETAASEEAPAPSVSHAHQAEGVQESVDSICPAEASNTIADDSRVGGPFATDVELSQGIVLKDPPITAVHSHAASDAVALRTSEEIALGATVDGSPTVPMEPQILMVKDVPYDTAAERPTPLEATPTKKTAVLTPGAVIGGRVTVGSNAISPVPEVSMEFVGEQSKVEKDTVTTAAGDIDIEDSGASEDTPAPSVTHAPANVYETSEPTVPDEGARLDDATRNVGMGTVQDNSECILREVEQRKSEDHPSLPLQDDSTEQG